MKQSTFLNTRNWYCVERTWFRNFLLWQCGILCCRNLIHCHAHAGAVL